MPVALPISSFGSVPTDVAESGTKMKPRASPLSTCGQITVDIAISNVGSITETAITQGAVAARPGGAPVIARGRWERPTCPARAGTAGPAPRIDLDVDGLAGTDLRELRLLEIGDDPDDPDVVGHDGHELLPRLHEHALLDSLACDAPGFGRRDRRVGQLERGLVEPLARRFEVGLGRAFGGDRVLELLARDEPTREQLVHPPRVGPRALRLHLPPSPLRAPLPDPRLLPA